MATKPALGSGARFSALKGKLAARPGVRNPAALAAFIGRKKYGPKKFQTLSSRSPLQESMHGVMAGHAKVGTFKTKKKGR